MAFTYKTLARFAQVSALLGISLLAPMGAHAQSEARMRHMSTDFAQRLHHAAHERSMNHHHAAMMRSASVSTSGQERMMSMIPGVERLAGRMGDFYVRSGQLMGLNLSAASRAVVSELGLSIVSTQTLEGLGIAVDVIAIPPKRSVKRMLRRLRRADSVGTYIPNALFKSSSDVAETDLQPNVSTKVARSSTQPALVAQSAPPVGLIDTAIYSKRVLADTALDVGDVAIQQVKFGQGDTLLPRQHGTTVAVQAVRSGARHLVVADVFSNETGFADAEAIVRALDWMAREKVPVINLSLTGPENALLESAVTALAARGHILVAAVGNDGPKSSPAYPAAYSQVVGVTAVDARLKIYHSANTGAAVDVAAIGVDVATPDDTVADTAQGPLSGTSFAAPVVAAILSTEFKGPVGNAADAARAFIDEIAIDLGPPGKDPLFGAGAVFPQPERARTAQFQAD